MSRELRATFDAVADLYDRARPAYPDAVIDDLIDLSGIPAGGRILEIGCGTGQATLPLAARGYRIVAVELGPRLASRARSRLASFPRVSVETAAFEDWPLPHEPFDLVFAATALHWLDHAAALPKIAAALRQQGVLGVVGGGHVAGGDTRFFHDVQACYERHMPGTPPGHRLPDPADVPRIAPEIDASGLFSAPRHRRHVWLREFTTASYIDELNTYSSHIALADADRRALLECIAARLDGEYSGHVSKAYLTDVVVAPRR